MRAPLAAPASAKATGGPLQAAGGGQRGQPAGLRQRRWRSAAQTNASARTPPASTWSTPGAVADLRPHRALSVTEGALVTADQATALVTVQQLDPIYVDVTQPSACCCA